MVAEAKLLTELIVERDEMGNGRFHQNHTQNPKAASPSPPIPKIAQATYPGKKAAASKDRFKN